MKLEESVISVDESIELYKLKIPQESKYYWMRWDSAYAPDDFDLVTKEDLSDCKENPIAYPESYSAFTASELSQILIKLISVNKP